MSNNNRKDMGERSPDHLIDDAPDKVTRRKFLSAAAFVGLSGAGLSLGLSSCNKKEGAQLHGQATGPLSPEVHPGQLDTYYGIWSGGHSGEMRIIGLPSGREIKRIPIFNIDPMWGWGITNESKKIMGTKPDGSVKYKTGDTHHVHGSYNDGTYDGKYFWINDKIHARLARIRGDTFETDRITELPNVQGFHGIFPDKRDPVDPAINHTTRVFCGCEFHIPQPNDGRDLNDPTKYYSVFTCVDAESMEVRWQCKVDGNMDLVASSYDGKLAASNQYNTENSTFFAGMMSAEHDSCVFFNIERIEKAIKAGNFYKIGGTGVPVVDGTKAKNQDPKTALTCYVPVPKNPHGVNASPDGKYFICSGKLSPTASVIELTKVHAWFDGNVKEPRECVIAEPEIGLGPLHTAFDGRGNAYTTLFLDSQIVKWNIDAAIKAFAGDKKAKVVVDRIDVHYQPGHTNASMSETREVDGKLLVVGCKFSKDRFLPVGPLHPENEQLIDISGEKMKLIHEAPVYPEPHDFVVVRRDIIKTRQIYRMDEFPDATTDMAGSKVVRHGPNKVTIHLTSAAPAYGLTEFKVKQGDTVTIFLTNHDKVEDLTHGFAVPKYDINFIVNPQETKSVTFKADKPGVYWCYCTHFCHALHLEMRSRMLVEPR
jgi:nitrous-oxide reductase